MIVKLDKAFVISKLLPGLPNGLESDYGYGISDKKDSNKTIQMITEKSDTYRNRQKDIIKQPNEK
jgi:hypothetical protein